MKAPARAALLVAFAVAGLNVTVRAAEATAKSRYATVRLLTEVTALQPAKPFMVALHIKLAPKWHTYWKNPGDSGMPVRIAWTLPDGWKAGELQFPAPIRAIDGGLALYGYEGEATFLTEITPPSSVLTRDVVLKAKVSWLECMDICISEKANLKLSLKMAASTASPAIDAAAAPLFAAARASLPKEERSFKFTVAEKAGNFVLMTSGTRALEAPLYFFPEVAGLIEAAHDQVTSRTALGFELSVKRPANASPLPASIKGVLVSGAGRSRRAYAVTATALARIVRPSH